MTLICPECHVRQQNIDLQACNQCQLPFENLNGIRVFFSRKDQSSELFKDYKKNYDLISEDDLADSIQDLNYLHTQTEKLFSYLPQHKEQSICEIGVGQGHLLKKLATLDPKQLIGVDIAPAYLSKLLSEGVPYNAFLANAENLPFENAFDLVIAADVLEHVLNAGNFLHSIHKAMKTNGTLVVRVPYLEDYSTYSSFKGCPYDFVHLRNFSAETLKILLEGAGFKVHKFHYDGFFLHRFRWCQPWFLPARLLRKITYLIYGNQLNTIPNWLGNLLIRPAEITAVCIKKD